VGVWSRWEVERASKRAKRVVESKYVLHAALKVELGSLVRAKL